MRSSQDPQDSLNLALISHSSQKGGIGQFNSVTFQETQSSPVAPSILQAPKNGEGIQFETGSHSERAFDNYVYIVEWIRVMVNVMKIINIKIATLIRFQLHLIHVEDYLIREIARLIGASTAGSTADKVAIAREMLRLIQSARRCDSKFIEMADGVPTRVLQKLRFELSDLEHWFGEEDHEGASSITGESLGDMKSDLPDAGDIAAAESETEAPRPPPFANDADPGDKSGLIEENLKIAERTKYLLLRKSALLSGVGQALDDLRKMLKEIREHWEKEADTLSGNPRSPEKDRKLRFLTSALEHTKREQELLDESNELRDDDVECVQKALSSLDGILVALSSGSLIKY